MMHSFQKFVLIVSTAHIYSFIFLFFYNYVKYRFLTGLSTTFRKMMKACAKTKNRPILFILLIGFFAETAFPFRFAHYRQQFVYDVFKKIFIPIPKSTFVLTHSSIEIANGFNLSNKPFPFSFGVEKKEKKTSVKFYRTFFRDFSIAPPPSQLHSMKVDILNTTYLLDMYLCSVAGRLIKKVKPIPRN